MHPTVVRLLEYARKHAHLFAPLLLVVSSAIVHVHGPVQHQLLVACGSWTLICVYAVFRAGLRTSDVEYTRVRGCLAGGFLALAAVCDRAACDREGIWSTKGLLPLFVVLVSENDVLSRYVALPKHAGTGSATDGSTTSERSQSTSYRLLAVVVLAASIVLATNFTASPTSALGISSVIFTATGLVIFEGASRTTQDGGNGRAGLVSANGSFFQRSPRDGIPKETHMAVLRDIAAAMAVACGVATAFMEPTLRPEAVTWVPLYHELPKGWKELQQHLSVQQVVLIIFVNAVVNVLMFTMVSQQGVNYTSFLSVFSTVCARLHLTTTIPGVWFTVIYGSSALLFLSGSSSSSFVDVRNSIRLRRIMFGVMAISVGLVFLRHVFKTDQYYNIRPGASTFQPSSPDNPLKPAPMDLSKGHPAAQLIQAAEKEQQEMLDRQSKTLAEAVQEYRRRNGIAPPPHFDKWYEFAARNGVVLIDEFDTVNQSLLPFWALKPSTIRARIAKALGHEDTALIGMTIRDGAVVKIEGGPDWQQQATSRMIKDFVQYLPDMDLGFNVHDEPRVVVPNDHLSAMIAKAKDDILPAVMKVKSPKNSFSSRSADLNDGKRFTETSITRFNRFAHQQTWTHARLSCPPSSPAQTFEDEAKDNLTSYATTPLAYVYNVTAFSDICNSPSLASTYGFFERPNAFSITHDLTPIFSQSKISSFQDILYPSPWYWFKKVEYVEKHDMSWENKTNKLYWRGSTTGGFSRNGGWRRQHRQRVVRRFNEPGKVGIHVKSELSSPDIDAETAFTLRNVSKRNYDPLVSILFTSIGQCDPGDCDAQREFFKLSNHAEPQDAWSYKHLLDIDGNAFSGRFYSFLQSRSLTYKMAVFREWHMEWLRPWVHYIPLSLMGEEYTDLVRWFAGGEALDEKEDDGVDGKSGGKRPDGNGDTLGERKAKEIAEKSREWAGKVLRNVDFEAWFFRLLLEYGRIVDDDRVNIGYPGP